VLNNLDFALLVWIASIGAGFLGSLTGLGGGVVIVPLLTLVFGADIRYAMGASLIAVIATSSGAASAYVKDGFTNLRVGMFLEIATTTGALLGAFLVALLSAPTIAVVFGLVLLGSAYQSSRPRPPQAISDTPDATAARLRMDASYPTPDGLRPYRVHGIPGGFALMFVAGTLSGLLGIGSGALKVVAMDQVMRLPFKVSTTTSNFMIGVTAAASAGIYLHRGYVHPILAMPVVLGVLPGSLLGARALVSAQVRALRIVFSVVVFFLAIEMIYSGLTGRL
jgi:uncharacterized membrane protein YfcA